MVYGYCRVSTKGQQRYGTSLEEQKREILDVYSGAEIVQEAYSGAKERPLFDELTEKLREGDILVVCKLDRFARSVSHGLEYITRLQDKGVKIHILNMGLIENTAMGRLIVTNLLAFAEFERAVILERTQAGKEAAAAADPNWRAGRPRKEIPDRIWEQYDEGLISCAEAARQLNINVSTFRRRRNSRMSENKV
jgi:DNA invertase Pin-like site-specific DNA recombinase